MQDRDSRAAELLERRCREFEAKIRAEMQAALKQLHDSAGGSIYRVTTEILPVFGIVYFFGKQDINFIS